MHSIRFLDRSLLNCIFKADTVLKIAEHLIKTLLFYNNSLGNQLKSHKIFTAHEAQVDVVEDVMSCISNTLQLFQLQQHPTCGDNSFCKLQNEPV